MYIYIYRERERKRDVCIYIYIYIYIDMCPNMCNRYTVTISAPLYSQMLYQLSYRRCYIFASVATCLKPGITHEIGTPDPN